MRECVIADDNFASVAAGQPELGRCEVLVHLAARVHMMHDEAVGPLAAYREANVEGRSTRPPRRGEWARAGSCS
jgi:UDP-glucose 4-epimerase